MPMSNENFFSFVASARCVRSCVQDSTEGDLPDVRRLLEEHDRRYHPHGFVPGQKCRYREALRQLSDEDSFDPSQVSETAQQKLDQSEDDETKVSVGKTPEPDPVGEWLPNMRDEIFSKVGSFFGGATIKEDSSGVGCVVGGNDVRNDDDLLGKIQAVVDAARAEYGLSSDGVRLAHYESGSPYAGRKPRIVFPFYRKGESQENRDRKGK